MSRATLLRYPRQVDTHKLEGYHSPISNFSCTKSAVKILQISIHSLRALLWWYHGFISVSIKSVLLTLVHTPSTSFSLPFVKNRFKDSKSHSVPSPSNQQPFQHQPLQTSIPEIRLMRLRPPSSREKNETIHCDLTHVNLDKSPHYSALSYTWGDPTPVIPIMLNNSPYLVTSNLAIALRHLQAHNGKNKSLMIWVDSVCINQVDNAEKSFQVGMMGRIYIQAAVVLAWLGPGDEGSGNGIAKMRKISHWFDEKLEAQLPVHFRDGMSKEHNATGLATFYNEWFSRNLPTLKIGKDSNADIPLQAIVSLLCRPYWSRVWIQQELKLAKETIFICGREDIYQKTFKEAMSICVQAVTRREFVDGEMKSLADALQQQTGPGLQMMYADSDLPLRDILYYATYPRDVGCLQCFNKRDMVYGFLSFANDCEALKIRADYAKPVELVYQEVVEAYLRLGDLEILAMAGLVNAAQHPSDLVLPSWIPDWSQPFSKPQLSRHNQLPSNRQTAAIQGPFYSTSGTITCPRSSVEHGILRLPGLIVDVVSYVGKCWSSYGESDSSEDENAARAFTEILNGMIQNRPESYVYSTEDGWKEAVLRSLATDAQGTDNTDQHGRGHLRWTRGCEFDRLIRNIISADEFDVRTFNNYQQLVATLDGTPFVTSKGYVGLGPAELQASDEICILFGGSMPFAIRNGYAGTHRIVQQVYVHGIMYGEFVKFAAGDGRPAQDFFFY